jgi:hypothetical protein
MTYNFDFNIEKDGSPYLTSDKAAKYISDIFYSRVSIEKPLLEARIADELAVTSEVELDSDEREYFFNILLSLPVDNYFKSRLVAPIAQDVINGVPTYVMRWQFKAGSTLTPVDDLSAPFNQFPNLWELAKYLVDNMPNTTNEEKAAKIIAESALYDATTVERYNPVVIQLGSIIGYNSDRLDQLFIFLRQIAAQ